MTVDNYQITLLTNVSKYKNSVFIFNYFHFLCSCKKKDTIPPVVTINSPLNNEIFQIPCNINIIGSTEDNRNIDRIEIDLVSENSASIVQN